MMPSKPWPIWALSALLVLGLPLVSFIYYPLLLRSGVLPPDSDSIAIPMFQDAMAAVFLTPVVLGAAWLCLRRYNPQSNLLAWRGDRPVRSVLATLVLGGAACALGALVFMDQQWAGPWYEYLWLIYELLWICWLLALRAAMVDQLDG